MKFLKLASFLLLIFFGGFIVSCGSQKNLQTHPEWAENPRNYYDADKYLLAVGSGSTLDEASSDAFSSLAQIFQMEIDATEKLYTEFTEISANNNFFSERTSQLIDNIKIGTKQELMNTTILESQVGSDGTYYALAGMDKSESSRIYNQEISNNRLKINEFELNADEESNILQKLILLKKTKTLAAVNENLSRQRNIILGGSSDTQLASQTLSRINEKFRNTRQKATIKIKSANASETIKASVAEVFQNQGLSITENGTSILDISIDYNTQKAEMNRNDSEFVKWELVIEINDNQQNRSFKTYMAEGRDGALSYQDALKRADTSARKKIMTDFNSFLNRELIDSNP